MSRILSLFLAFSLLVLSGCQTEVEDLTPQENGESITANSVTADYVARTSAMDGSFDNIVDGASCIAIDFPYLVVVNEIEIMIESVEDLRFIEEILDESDLDQDFLELVFPITIITSDHTKVVINSPDELEELAEKCIENGDDDDIECIDFVYPVTVFTFDSETQQTSSVTLESDREMYKFFKSLDDDTRVGFRFPVTLETYDGIRFQVNSHEELKRLFEEYKEVCDEDDDDDYNDDDFTKERLDQYLVKCPWTVLQFVKDGANQTDQYEAYLMTFKEDGSVKVRDRLGNILNGEWETSLGDRGVVLELEFGVLVDFNLEWFVYEIEEGKIKLYTEEGSKIVMKRNCDPDPDPAATLRNILKECSWLIRHVEQQGEPMRRLLGYEFNFMAEGKVTLSNSVVTHDGTWEVGTNAEGMLVLSIDIGEEPSLNFEWPIQDLRNDRLKFGIEEIGYELFLQRVCNDNNEDDDVVEIREIMRSGAWKVANFESSLNVDHQVYYAYTFEFGAEHLMSMTLGETGTTEAGTWRVIRNADGQLKVYLNGGENEPLNVLTDRYDLASITENRIELHVQGETDGSFKVLVFERP